MDILWIVTLSSFYFNAIATLIIKQDLTKIESDLCVPDAPPPQCCVTSVAISDAHASTLLTELEVLTVFNLHN